MNLKKRYSMDYSYKLNKRKRINSDSNKKIKKYKKDSESSDEDDFDFFNEKEEIYSNKNHIWFNTDVSKKSTNKLVRIIHEKNIQFTDSTQKLADIATLEPKPLYLHINSYGGDLLACMAVIDAIKNSKIPIHTIVEGVAASAGTLMSVVGHYRYITQNSYMLIHQLSSGMEGKMNELEEEMVNNNVFMDRIKNIYKNNTTMKINEITDALKHDLWWDSKTCLKKGLVDEIINPNSKL